MIRKPRLMEVIRFERKLKDEGLGAGDIAKLVFEKFGIKDCFRFFPGCPKRIDWLNRNIPFHVKQ